MVNISTIASMLLWTWTIHSSAGSIIGHDSYEYRSILALLIFTLTSLLTRPFTRVSAINIVKSVKLMTNPYSLLKAALSQCV